MNAWDSIPRYRDIIEHNFWGAPVVYQLIFMGVAALLVIAFILRGWAVGVGHLLLGSLKWLGAAAAGGVVLYFSPGLSSAIFGLAEDTGRLVDAAVGAGLALGVFWVLSRFMFGERGALESAGMALLGIPFGVIQGFLAVFVLAMAIRLVGGVAQFKLDTTWEQSDVTWFFQEAADWKRALSTGMMGYYLNWFDPLTPGTYEILVKLMVASQSGGKAAKLLYAEPKAALLLRSGELRALLTDEKALQYLREKSYFKLVSSPVFLRAAWSSELRPDLLDPELRQALEGESEEE